jgi:adiponectin receptor
MMATSDKKSGAQQDHGSVLDTKETGSVDDIWHALINWDDLPHWLQDNQFIHSGYRKASYSYARSIQSIFHRPHNETVNIWTHLIPATLCLPAAGYLYNILKPRYELASRADILAMSCFFLGAAFCLGLSASFHTFSNHSPSVAQFWNRLDYAGISLLIAGSFVPSVYYGFWCHPAKQWSYWIMVGSGRIMTPTSS